MITLRENDIRRLNHILQLAGANVDALADSEWNGLLDDLYFAVFGEKGRVFRQDMFHFAATRAGVKATQQGLRAQLPILQHLKGEDPAPRFKLSAQTLYLATAKGGFTCRYLCEDCPTMIYSTLAYLLERSKVTQTEILSCANPRCEAFFVPLRKPHAGQRSFCSQRCRNLFAARAYRMKQAGQLREKEGERSRRRYDEKVHARLPGAKIARHPRKTR